MMEERVLSIIHTGDRVLLERIRVGFGAGFVGGLYCKPQEQESFVEAMVCELGERGIVPVRYEPRGVLNISFEHSDLELRTHVYDVTEYQADLPRGNGLRWYARPPYDSMLSDYELWLPRFLRGEGVLGRLVYEHPQCPMLLARYLFQSRRLRTAAASA